MNRLTTQLYEGEIWTISTCFGYDKKHTAIAIGAQLEGLAVFRRHNMQDEIPHGLLRELVDFDMDQAFDSLAIVALDGSDVDIEYLHNLGAAQLEINQDREVSRLEESIHNAVSQGYGSLVGGGS